MLDHSRQLLSTIIFHHFCTMLSLNIRLVRQRWQDHVAGGAFAVKGYYNITSSKTGATRLWNVTNKFNINRRRSLLMAICLTCGEWLALPFRSFSKLRRKPKNKKCTREWCLLKAIFNQMLSTSWQKFSYRPTRVLASTHININCRIDDPTKPLNQSWWFSLRRPNLNIMFQNQSPSPPIHISFNENHRSVNIALCLTKSRSGPAICSINQMTENCSYVTNLCTLWRQLLPLQSITA